MLISKSSLPLQNIKYFAIFRKKTIHCAWTWQKNISKKNPAKPGQRSSRSREIPSSRSPEKEDDFSQGWLYQ